jgi:uncharacterized protein (TIGR02996 family)
MPLVPWGDGGICPTVPTPTFDPDTFREMLDAIRRQRERVAARQFIEATRREARRRRARRARPKKNYQERPMGETERALFQNVLDNPTDPAAKNIYADWLEEHNLERLAYAYRWAAARGRHPYVERGKDPEDDIVLWDRQRGRKAPVKHFHRLPRTVFLALRPPLIRGVHQCDSVAHAFVMLADALWRLQRAASPQESDDD